MFIISAGKTFNDIDAFACAIAYAELLRKEGNDALVAFPGPLNHTVTPLALEQSADYVKEYSLQSTDQLIYVDISDPAYFSFGKASEAQVVEIYDHHYGWSEYWKAKIGNRSHIERMGAAATLIWEEFKHRGHTETISQSSANLLMLGVLQNTLNFVSPETTERDRVAFAELLQRGSLPDGWQERYFKECADAFDTNFEDVLRNDTKVFEGLFGEYGLVFSQLEVTENPEELLASLKGRVDTFWENAQNKKCLLNIADILSKTSLFYSNDSEWLRAAIMPLFTTTMDKGDGFFKVPLIQRKQVLKLMQDAGLYKTDRA